MSEVLYPSGYGTTERTLDDLMDRHCPIAVAEPEFRRRLRAWLESKGGRIGIGDVLPRSRGNTVSSASASNRSFHQLQQFADGSWWAAAVDLVVRRGGGLGHSSGAVPWSEVPVQNSAEAAFWGVHINIANESWHVQCVEMDGFSSWVRDGRKRPVPNYGVVEGKVTDEQFKVLDAKLDRINARLDLLGSRASIQASTAKGHTGLLKRILGRPNV